MVSQLSTFKRVFCGWLDDFTNIVEGEARNIVLLMTLSPVLFESVCAFSRCSGVVCMLKKEVSMYVASNNSICLRISGANFYIGKAQ